MKPLQAIIVAILVVVGALYWYSGQQQQHYDVDAQRYLRQALTDIAAWQRENIKKHLASQMLVAIDDTQVDALIERYRGLGAFKQLDDVQFGRLTAALSLFSANTLLSYHGTATFENGNTSLTVTLIINEGSFRIYNFSFGAPQNNSPPQ